MKIVNDFSTSVQKALDEIDPNWRRYEGLIVCGTHSPKDWELQIKLIKTAREMMFPFLGICFGHQLAAIEYARNCLRIDNATSEEFNVHGTFVVRKRKDGLKVGLHNGDTYWNNFEVDPEIEQKWVKLDNMFTTQAHPEYQSSIDKPHKLLVDFINYARQYSKR